MPVAIRLLLRAALLVLAALPAPGQALTVRCVQTPGALVSAVDDALASSDSLFMIKLRQGRYDLTTALDDVQWSRANQVIEISGGWTGPNGTCSDLQFGYGTTLLAGPPLTRTLWTNVSGAGSLLYIHDVSITTTGQPPGNGACLYANVEASGTLRIERVRFTGCSGGAGSSSASGEINSVGTLSIRDVLIENGQALRNGGMTIYTAGNGITQLAHLTVTGNHSSHPDASASGLTLINVANARAYLSNSVLWGNDASRPDLYLSGGLQWLARVHTGSRGGIEPAGDTVPGSGDPGFIAVGNPHLRPDSLLIDSGLADPPGGSGSFDAEGRPRFVGAGVDVGAFEAAPLSDMIFADGFN